MWLNWPNCRQRKTRKTHNPITALCTIIGNFQSGHSRLLPAARTAGGKVEFRGKYDNFPLLLCWLPTAPPKTSDRFFKATHVDQLARLSLLFCVVASFIFWRIFRVFCRSSAVPARGIRSCARNAIAAHFALKQNK